MLVNLNEVLLPAKRDQYAVGLFNAVNLELARGIINAAETMQSPVIMGTAEVLLPYGPLEEVSSNPSFKMLMHSWTHSSQMRTPGPWIIRWTWLSCLPQKEHRRPFLLSSLMIIPRFWKFAQKPCLRAGPKPAPDGTYFLLVMILSIRPKSSASWAVIQLSRSETSLICSGVLPVLLARI